MTEKEKPLAITDLTYDMCDMQLNGLAVYLTAALDGNTFDVDYWPKLKNYTKAELAKIIEYLKDNYKYPTFPRIPDFIQARNAIKNYSSYKPTPNKIDGYSMNDKTQRVKYAEEYTRDIRALVEKFRIPNAKGEGRDKETIRRENIYKRMYAANKVFSYKIYREQPKENPWVDRSLMNNIGGTFLLPEEKLL